MKLDREVRHKSEDIQDDVLNDAVRAIRRRVKVINRNYDIPYIAGYSMDGHTVFIDRHLPRSFRWLLKTVRVEPFLLTYEIVEKALLDELRLHYLHAHQIAVRAERDAVKAAGVSWGAYQRFMKQHERQIEEETIVKVPATLIYPLPGRKRFQAARTARAQRAISVAVLLGNTAENADIRSQNCDEYVKFHSTYHPSCVPCASKPYARLYRTMRSNLAGAGAERKRLGLRGQDGWISGPAPYPQGASDGLFSKRLRLDGRVCGYWQGSVEAEGARRHHRWRSDCSQCHRPTGFSGAAS